MSTGSTIAPRRSGACGKAWRKASSAFSCAEKSSRARLPWCARRTGRAGCSSSTRTAYAAQIDVTERNRSVLSGVAVEDLKVFPAQRIPASRLVPTGKIEPMPAKLSPMLAESGDAPFNDPDWMWEPKLDGYRVLAFVERGQSEAALAPRACTGRTLSSLDRGARPAGGEQHDPGRRDRGVRRGRQTLLQRAAESRSVEDGAGDRGGRPEDARGVLLLRSAAFRRRRSAQRRLIGIGGAISRSACCHRRSCNSCTQRRTARR